MLLYLYLYCMYVLTYRSMEFFPSLPELSSTVLCPVDTLAEALSNVPNIRVSIHSFFTSPYALFTHLALFTHYTPHTLQQMTSSQSWLSGATPCACLLVEVERGVLNSVRDQLKQNLTRNLQGPLNHLETFSKPPPHTHTHTSTHSQAHTHTHTYPHTHKQKNLSS